MKAIRLNVLGAGRAARAVARWLAASPSIAIGQVANRRLASAQRAVEVIGAGRAVTRITGLKEDDWLLIGLTDQALASMPADRVGGRPALAFHLSGSLDSSLLRPWAALVASTHPARAFDGSDRTLDGMAGTWVTAEGDEAALACLRPLFVDAGAVWQTVERADKARYHAAAVVASNYLVTLTALARELAEAAGFDAGDARRFLHNLSAGTLANLADADPAQALTGPIERGDLDQVRRLQAAMAEACPDSAALQAELGRATLRLARRARGPRPADDAIAAIFTTP